MRKSAAIVLFLITLVIVCPQPIKAQESTNITINADGSISPATAPILQTSTVYCLIGDTNANITVYASNIILDGSGHTVSSVLLQRTLNVTIKNFVVASRSERIGISLSDASNNLIINNTVTGFYSPLAMNGILYAGIHVKGGKANTIIQNNLRHNLNEMNFFKTSSNVIVQNNVTSNPIYNFHGPYTFGISFYSASNNTIYHNNFVNSTNLAKVDDSINVWDNGFPSGGNYWSDYRTKYPNAGMIENSGIGNTPYVVDAQNKDGYPLMEPFYAVASEASNPSPESPTVSNQEDSMTTVTTVVGIFAIIIAIIAGLAVTFKKRRR